MRIPPEDIAIAFGIIISVVAIIEYRKCQWKRHEDARDIIDSQKELVAIVTNLTISFEESVNKIANAFTALAESIQNSVDYNFTMTNDHGIKTGKHERRKTNEH